MGHSKTPTPEIDQDIELLGKTWTVENNIEMVRWVDGLETEANKITWRRLYLKCYETKPCVPAEEMRIDDDTLAQMMAVVI